MDWRQALTPIHSLNRIKYIGEIGQIEFSYTGNELRPPEGNRGPESTGGCWGGGGIANNFMGSSEQRAAVEHSEGATTQQETEPSEVGCRKQPYMIHPYRTPPL